MGHAPVWPVMNVTYLMIRRYALPDKATFVIFSHLMSLCGEGEPVTLQNKVAHSFLVSLSRIERLQDVVCDGSTGWINGPSTEVCVVALNGGHFFGRRSRQETLPRASKRCPRLWV